VRGGCLPKCLEQAGGGCRWRSKWGVNQDTNDDARNKNCWGLVGAPHFKLGRLNIWQLGLLGQPHVDDDFTIHEALWIYSPEFFSSGWWFSRFRCCACKWVWINTYFYTIFSGLFTSIYQLFWCEQKGYLVLTHPQIWDVPISPSICQSSHLLEVFQHQSGAQGLVRMDRFGMVYPLVMSK